MKGRYEIQVCHLSDTLVGKPAEWKTFYSARSRRTIRGARKEFWKWVTREWDFTMDRPIFRIYDTKKNEVVSS